MGTSINLLRSPIAASRARSLLAYLLDMSRRSLRGSLPSGLLVTISRSAHIFNRNKARSVSGMTIPSYEIGK